MATLAFAPDVSSLVLVSSLAPNNFPIFEPIFDPAAAADASPLRESSSPFVLSGGADGVAVGGLSFTTVAVTGSAFTGAFEYAFVTGVAVTGVAAPYSTSLFEVAE